MKYLLYIFLGFLQGLTEPLPISSSGHLYLFKSIFNTDLATDLNFEIFVNFASFLAIFYIFRKDIKKLVASFFTYIFNKEKRPTLKNDFHYCILIIISSIPVGIAGLLLKSTLENALNIKWLGLAFLLTALSLFIVKNIKGTKGDYDITIKDAIIIGLLQTIALIPGISRSGIVLVGCLLCNLKRESALKYTFMLYFPVSIASIILAVPDFISSPQFYQFPYYIVGMITTLIVTYYSYKWLSNIVKKGHLAKFSIYLILLSIFIFIYFR